VGRWLVTVIVLGACGRLGFDPLVTNDTAPAARRDCEGHEAAVFCDGFEDPTLPKWTVDGQAASMQLVTPAPPLGERLLQSDTQGTMQASEAVARFPAIASGTLYVRGWFYVPSGFTVIHFDLLDALSVGFGGLAVFGYNGNLSLYESTAGALGADGPPLPTDRWMCIELEIQVSDPGNAYLRLDGSIVASFANIDLLPGSGFETVAVGLPWTDDGQPAVRTYADEIIVDTKPIGCD